MKFKSFQSQCAVFVVRQKLWVDLQRATFRRKILSGGHFKWILFNNMDRETMWGFPVWLKSLERLSFERWFMLHMKQVLRSGRETSAYVTDFTLENQDWNPSLQILWKVASTLTERPTKKWNETAVNYKILTALHHSEVISSIYSEKEQETANALPRTGKIFVSFERWEKIKTWRFVQTLKNGQIVVRWFCETLFLKLDTRSINVSKTENFSEKAVEQKSQAFLIQIFVHSVLILMTYNN